MEGSSSVIRPVQVEGGKSKEGKGSWEKWSSSSSAPAAPAPPFYALVAFATVLCIRQMRVRQSPQILA